MQLSSRAHVAPFHVMEVMRAAFARERAGEAVHHLEVGQPSTPAPAGVRAAAVAALAADRLGYTDALGIPELRHAIAGYYRVRHGLTVSPDRVVVTCGSSGAFVLAFLALFAPGARVAMAAPGYPCYRNILVTLGVEPVAVPVEAETRFQPTPALLDRAGGPWAGLIVASPANPTGTMLSRADLAALAGWCREQGAWLVSDEIYHGITYGPPAETALAVSDDAIVVNSFSKYYSMTGWRLGWMVVPELLVRPLERLAQNLFISPPTLSQRAALAAFACGEELEGHVARYARNRALLLEGLPAAGFSRFAPADGAFYLYADVSHLTDDSEVLCREILAATGVALTPGIDFDPGRGRRFVRFSFAGATETIVAAIAKLQEWRAAQPG